MSKTLLINGLNYSGMTNLTGFTLVTAADMGQVGTGGIVYEDQLAAVTIPAWKFSSFSESLASPNLVWAGFSANRKLSRGTLKTGTARTWDVDMLDVNVMLDQSVIRSQSAIRDKETDEARILWLSTHTSLAFVDTYSNPSSGTTVNMDEQDLRGQTPMDVLRECAEASGKNFFLIFDNATSLYTLFYGKGNTTSATWRNTTNRISDDPADQDGDTFYPIEPTRLLDASTIFSGVNVQFDKGSVYVADSAVATAYKSREITIQADNRTVDGATSTAEEFLDQSDSDVDDITCAVHVTAEQVAIFRAGFQYQVKLKHLDMPAFVYRRVTRATVTPAPGAHEDGREYRVFLEFTPRVNTKRHTRPTTIRPVLDDETVPNGGFERGARDEDNYINDWNVVAGTAQARQVSGSGTTGNPKAHGGIRTLRIEQRTAASEVWTQDFAPVQGLRKYIIRAYFMFNEGGSTYGANPPQIQIYWYTSARVQIGSPSVETWLTGCTKFNWNRYAIVRQAPVTAAYRKIRIFASQGTVGRFWFFDDVSFDRTDLNVGSSVPPD